MKKIAKMPTIVGVVILVFGLVAGLFLINSTQVFKLGAQAEAIPQNVRITNSTESSFSITWVTDIDSTGFIKWGTSANVVNSVVVEESSAKSLVHSVNVTGLKQNTDIYIIINSDGKDYKNEGIPWQTKTLPQKASSTIPLIGSGVILSPDETYPARALVFITVNGVTLSSLTSEEGSWVIPISSFVSSVPDTTALEITVSGGSLGNSQGIIYPQAIKSTPAMVLGKTYDFRTITTTDTGNSPESSLSIPESIQVSSRFEVDKSATPKSTNNVSLDSIDDKEIVTTTDPEFFGGAPAGTQIEIQVESELQTATVKTPSSGKWSWSAPNDLEPGEHTVTLKWTDTNGVIRTLTRNFIVQASEGPAFVSTPSGTPSTTTKPTSTAKATATSTTMASLTPTGTPPALPDSGSLTPTILLFIMGMGVLTSSYFVWKYANA